MLSSLHSMKRKLDDDAAPEKKIYGMERQSVFNMSMCKLKMSPIKRVEPSLWRSVLILNTLKQIECELEEEGEPVKPVFDPGILSGPECVLDTLPEVDGSLLTGVEILTLQSNPQVVVPYTAASDRLDKDAAVSGSPTLQDLSPTKYMFKDFSEPVLPLPGAMPSSPNCIKVDEMLTDVDLSHDDFDMFSSLAASMKLTSLTPLSAEEVLHSFPGHNGSSLPETYSTLLNTQFNHYCKNDRMDELDNIMQIIVGM